MSRTGSPVSSTCRKHSSVSAPSFPSTSPTVRPRCASGGWAVQRGQRVVDPDEAKLSVHEREPDGRPDEDGVEQGEGFAPRPQRRAGFLEQPRVVDRDGGTAGKILRSRRSASVVFPAGFGRGEHDRAQGAVPARMGTISRSGAHGPEPVEVLRIARERLEHGPPGFSRDEQRRSRPNHPGHRILGNST